MLPGILILIYLAIGLILGCVAIVYNSLISKGFDCFFEMIAEAIACLLIYGLLWPFSIFSLGSMIQEWNEMENDRRNGHR
jgi:hypothetical protein